MTRNEALRILGVRDDQTGEEIKGRYHELIKMFHPDSTGDAESAELMYAINEAYDYLLTNPLPAAVTKASPKSSDMRDQTVGANPPVNSGQTGASGVRVLGSNSDIMAAGERRRDRARYDRLQRQYDKIKDERKKEQQAKIDDALSDTLYNEAMERIHAIRAAEVTAEIIEAMFFGNNPKIQKNTKEQVDK
ncbi:MAG: DnaJ domain-containing protein [Lachnospiraceae bacterium]|nr:DnaJ domain-containing protein [Lachnospiraceae bacterium]